MDKLLYKNAGNSSSIGKFKMTIYNNTPTGVIIFGNK